MIRRIVTCFLAPILLLAVCTGLSEGSGDGFIVGVASRIAHFMLIWPLDLLAALGITSVDEGFYGRWVGVSLVASIVFFGMLLFVVSALLALRRKV